MLAWNDDVRVRTAGALTRCLPRLLYPSFYSFLYYLLLYLLSIFLYYTPLSEVGWPRKCKAP